MKRTLLSLAAMAATGAARAQSGAALFGEPELDPPLPAAPRIGQLLNDPHEAAMREMLAGVIVQWAVDRMASGHAHTFGVDLGRGYAEHRMAVKSRQIGVTASLELRPRPVMQIIDEAVLHMDPENARRLDSIMQAQLAEMTQAATVPRKMLLRPYQRKAFERLSAMYPGRVPLDPIA